MRPRSTRFLVAVGGGGLIGGIAAWFEGRMQIVAVEPEASPTLHAALAASDGRSTRRRAGLPPTVSRRAASAQLMFRDRAHSRRSR